MNARIPFVTVIALLVSVATVAVLLTSQRGIAQTSAVEDERAAELAILFARDDERFGGLRGKLTDLRGAVMSYDDAISIVYQSPNAATQDNDSLRNRSVWLLIMEGDFVEHVPQTPDIPAKEVPHTQMAVILDSITGEIIEEILLPKEKPLILDNLPKQDIPADLEKPIELPTRIEAPTVEPLPTETAPNQ